MQTELVSRLIQINPSFSLDNLLLKEIERQDRQKRYSSDMGGKFYHALLSSLPKVKCNISVFLKQYDNDTKFSMSIRDTSLATCHIIPVVDALRKIGVLNITHEWSCNIFSIRGTFLSLNLDDFITDIKQLGEDMEKTKSGYPTIEYDQNHISCMNMSIF